MRSSAERTMAAALRKRGVPFEEQASDLIGTPDFVFRPQRIALFVHGCYWHHHQCNAMSRQPHSMRDLARVRARIERDQSVKRGLEAAGWLVLVAWECHLRGSSAPIVDHLVAQRLSRSV